MDILKSIASQTGLRMEQVTAAVELFDAGNTIPFVARYRKEATRNLDEEQLRQISELVEKLRALDERRQAVLKSSEEQGKLSDELRAEIERAETMTALEDLYQPYKPKRRTRASIARERGLQPLGQPGAQHTVFTDGRDVKLRGKQGSGCAHRKCKYTFTSAISIFFLR